MGMKPDSGQCAYGRKKNKSGALQRFQHVHLDATVLRSEVEHEKNRIWWKINETTSVLVQTVISAMHCCDLNIFIQCIYCRTGLVCIEQCGSVGFHVIICYLL